MTDKAPENENTNDNNKQLSLFMALTKSLLSNDSKKRIKRKNLSSKITSTIMNNPKFELYLKMDKNLKIKDQLNSIHCKVCYRDILLLKHHDKEIHIFAKSLLYKLTNNNDTLTNIMLLTIFANYSSILPNALIIFNEQDNDNKENEILSKLRAITVIIDRLNELFKRSNSLKTTYLTQMNELNFKFNFIICNLYSRPNGVGNWNLEPFKLPSIDVQMELIEFWTKYRQFIPNDVNFRTNYLLRWLCLLPIDFDNHLLSKLLNIMSINFNNIDCSDSSETVITLYTLLGFLGGSSISIYRNNTNKNTPISIMTYKIMERIPIELKDNLLKNNNLNDLIKKLGVNQFEIIISNMFKWPQTDIIYSWIIDILKNIEENGYFLLLNKLSVLHGNKIAFQLKEIDKTNLNGCIIILKYLIYGYQSSPDAFHNIISSLVDTINILKLLIEDSFYYQQLYEIIQLCHIMMFRFPGFPDKYPTLASILHENKYKHPDLYKEPNEQQIRNILKRYQWKAKRTPINGGTNNNNNYSSSSAYSYSSQSFSSSSSFTISKPSKRDKITDKAGLTNLGATCYMNSIIQALYLSKQFKKKLLHLKTINYKDNDKLNKDKWIKMKNVTCELQNIFGHLKFTKRQAVSTRKFVNLLPNPWTAGRQQDASEFAKYLLDCIWETIQSSNNVLKYNNNDEKSKIDPYFGGLQENNIKCNKCNNISSKSECFTEIPLSMTHKDIKDENKEELCTKKMIEQHFGIEILKGDNKYFCSKCNEKVEAQRYTKIINPPNHLIICFKRFSWNYQTMKRIKKSDWVNCPLILEIPIHSNQNNNDYIQKYILYAAVIHSGRSAEFGHYYTIGRVINNDNNNNNDNNDKWFMFNDRNVSISTYDKLCNVSHIYKTDVPYLLFYKRVDKMDDVDDVQDINKNIDNIDNLNENDDDQEKDDNNNDEWMSLIVNKDNESFERQLKQYQDSESN